MWAIIAVLALATWQIWTLRGGGGDSVPLDGQHALDKLFLHGLAWRVGMAGQGEGNRLPGRLQKRAVLSGAAFFMNPL